MSGMLDVAYCVMYNVCLSHDSRSMPQMLRKLYANMRRKLYGAMCLPLYGDASKSGNQGNLLVTYCNGHWDPLSIRHVGSKKRIPHIPNGCFA